MLTQGTKYSYEVRRALPFKKKCPFISVIRHQTEEFSRRNV